MTREEKIIKRKTRKSKRFQSRKQEKAAISDLREKIPVEVDRYILREEVKKGNTSGYSWKDPTSYTGRSQECEMGGCCSFPCDGSC
jgi:hypothetical protein